MNNENKNIQSDELVKDFLNDWYSVEDLYKTAAKAGSILINLAAIKQLNEEDTRVINALLEQHLMMTDIMDKVRED